MAHTNSTPNYNLPQFLGTDKPAWLTDINNAMSDIDTAIAAAKTTADTADAAVSGLAVTVGNHTSQLSTLSGAVTSQGNTLNTVTALIGNGLPTTTDQTIIGAINELAALVEAGKVSITADGVKNIGELLDALHTLIDTSKLSDSSVFKMTLGAGNYRFAKLTSITSSSIDFVKVSTSGTAFADIVTYSLMASGSKQYRIECNADDTIQGQDLSSNVPSSGTVFEVIY